MSYTIEHSKGFSDFVFCVVVRVLFPHQLQKVWKMQLASCVIVHVIYHVLFESNRHYLDQKYLILYVPGFQLHWGFRRRTVKAAPVVLWL